jgi:hypothetical protein
VPDIGRIPRSIVSQVQSVLGRTIADSNPAVAEVWRQARQTVLGRLSGQPTRELMIGRLYNDTRDEFWRLVRGNEEASRWFSEGGFVFQGGERTAPRVNIFTDFPGQEREFILSLDHIAPKAQGENWRMALDPENLRFVSFWDNWLLAQIERRLAALPQ